MIRHRLNLEEFQALLEKAPEGVRLELLEGEVYEMAPIGSEHAGLVTYLAKSLETGLYPKLLPRPPLACFKSSWVTS
ncbi:Uma2 family endonuclease [Thermus composti]|uniref:Uma2 family endonuclease n=1 Tax=Thermus composti TaxID=532059 RepID=A0ABV6Q356_9DEIN